MAELVPAILAKSLTEFEAKIRQVEDLVDMVQIDVMDGKFVPNETFNEIDKIAEVETSLKYDIHLMVADVAGAIDRWSGLNPQRITFHLEAVDSDKIEEIIGEIRNLDMEVGLAINPDTDLAEIEPQLAKIDFVLVMGVNPGFSGQKFQGSTLERIKEIKKDHPDLKVGVDGGVNTDNAADLVAAGVDELAVGSRIFTSNDVRAAVEEFSRYIRVTITK
ncbi:MAG: ribulose-phosphate 3-epimerase [Parcubacteria group bacterium]|nr:ribulose-phosphate 3-epimerase [Parcubacteria group bacterium]